MKRDKAVMASVLGSLAVLAGELVTFILTSLWTHTCDDFCIDSVIVTVGRYNWFFGLWVDLIAGGIVGVLLYYALVKLNSEYILFKAITFSLISWLIAEAYVTAFVEGRYMDFRPTADYLVHIAGALANGVALGLLFKCVLFGKADKDTE